MNGIIANTVRCQGPLYIMAYYLHRTHISCPVYFKPSLDDLRCLIQGKCQVAELLYCAGKNTKEKHPQVSIQIQLFFQNNFNLLSFEPMDMYPWLCGPDYIQADLDYNQLLCNHKHCRRILVLWLLKRAFLSPSGRPKVAFSPGSTKKPALLRV